MNQSLTVLVNSTDSFEDCWHAFFKLFQVYWPDCPYKIFLNTEYKELEYEGLDIKSSKVGCGWTGSKHIPWSDCLSRCLDQIDTDYILYLQEDYFLNGRVDSKLIADFVDLMERERVGHIRLMELDRSAEYEEYEPHELLWIVSPRANYRLSLQAGLWRKDSLKSYLRPGESAWHMERYGNARTYRTNELFLCQNLDHFNGSRLPVYPYKPTGIIRGKWNEDAVSELFEQHGINIDFSIRGIYQTTLLDKLLITVRAWLRRLGFLTIAQLSSLRQ